MSLEEPNPVATGASGTETGTSQAVQAAPSRTLHAAITLLRSLRPRILELMQNSPLVVGLHRVDIMRPDQGQLEKAHVMWAGPAFEGGSGDAYRLKSVAGQSDGTYKSFLTHVHYLS